MGKKHLLKGLIFDDLVKSLKRHISVIPANPGSGPGQAPESSYFKYLEIIWTPVSTGVTTSYEVIIFVFLMTYNPLPITCFVFVA